MLLWYSIVLYSYYILTSNSLALADIKTASILDNFQGSPEVPCWALLTKDPLMYLIPLIQLGTLISAHSQTLTAVSSPSQVVSERTEQVSVQGVFHFAYFWSTENGPLCPVVSECSTLLGWLRLGCHHTHCRLLVLGPPTQDMHSRLQGCFRFQRLFRNVPPLSHLSSQCGVLLFWFLCCAVNHFKLTGK